MKLLTLGTLAVAAASPMQVAAQEVKAEDTIYEVPQVGTVTIDVNADTVTTTAAVEPESIILGLAGAGAIISAIGGGIRWWKNRGGDNVPLDGSTGTDTSTQTYQD